MSHKVAVSNENLPQPSIEKPTVDFEQQKTLFEERIKSCKGEKLLDAYTKYLEWLDRQSRSEISGFSSGHVDMKQLVRGAFAALHKDEAIRRDPRFLDIALRLARQQPAVYETLHKRRYLTSFAAFYVHWVRYLVCAGRQQQAVRLLTEVIQAGEAKPLQLLTDLLRDIQSGVVIAPPASPARSSQLRAPFQVYQDNEGNLQRRVAASPSSNPSSKPSSTGSNSNAFAEPVLEPGGRYILETLSDAFVRKYDFLRIYPSDSSAEYQFEELRARRWAKNREKKRAEEQISAQQEEIARLTREMQRLTRLIADCANNPQQLQKIALQLQKTQLNITMAEEALAAGENEPSTKDDISSNSHSSVPNVSRSQLDVTRQMKAMFWNGTLADSVSGTPSSALPTDDHSASASYDHPPSKTKPPTSGGFKIFSDSSNDAVAEPQKPKPFEVFVDTSARSSGHGANNNNVEFMRNPQPVSKDVLPIDKENQPDVLGVKRGHSSPPSNGDKRSASDRPRNGSGSENVRSDIAAALPAFRTVPFAAPPSSENGTSPSVSSKPIAVFIDAENGSVRPVVFVDQENVRLGVPVASGSSRPVVPAPVPGPSSGCRVSAMDPENRPPIGDSMQPFGNVQHRPVPGTSTSKDVYNDKFDDENDENKPPPGYQKAPKRPSLSGVLQPAKDIPVRPISPSPPTSESPTPSSSSGSDELEGITPLSAGDDTMANLPKRIASTPSKDCSRMNDDFTFGRITLAVEMMRKQKERAISPSDNDVINGNVAAEGAVVAPAPDAGRISPLMQADAKLTSTTSVGVTPPAINNNGLKQAQNNFPVANNAAKIVSSISAEGFEGPRILSAVDQNGGAPKTPGNLSVILEVSKEHLSSLRKSSSVSGSSSSSSSSSTAPSLCTTAIRTTTCQTIVEDAEDAARNASSISESQAGVDEADVVDPFAASTRNAIVNRHAAKFLRYEDFFDLSSSRIPVLRQGSNICYGSFSVTVDKFVTQGAYAKVYKCHKNEPLISLEMSQRSVAEATTCLIKDDEVALKVLKDTSDGMWEFYVLKEASERMEDLCTPCVSKSIPIPMAGAVFENAFVIAMHFMPHGTLLDFVNKLQKVPEPIALYLTLEMLVIVTQLHLMGIIHSDVKPDNFLLRKIPSIRAMLEVEEKTQCLALIDFGRAIDMQAMPPGARFNVAGTKKDLCCPEMLDGRQWTYQPDWYGVANCVHVLLFSAYIQIEKSKSSGRWNITKTINGRLFEHAEFWRTLFSTLLNLPADNAAQTDAVMTLLCSALDIIKSMSPFSTDLQKKLEHIAELYAV